MIRKWDITNKALNQKIIDGVITRIQDIEDPETVGAIAAQDIIDIVLESAGPEIFNKAIDESMKLMRERLEEIEYTIEDLKQL